MKLDQDREIIEVARHTEQVTFQPSTRRTRSGFNLPMLVHERLAFSPEEYIRRYDLIQDAMARMELDALLVRGPENITYVIGYETPAITNTIASSSRALASRSSWCATSNG